MSVHFEKIRVKKINRETAECVSVLFDIPDTLREKFAYRHGQHLTLRTFINDEEIRRSYSLCSSPGEKEWKVAIKKVNNGLFSSFANDTLKPGDFIELMPPMGNFSHELEPSKKKSYVMFAAGSGITPILSIIKAILTTEKQSCITLIYGNKTRASIIFKDELEDLKNKYIDRFSIIHILSRENTDAPINSGRIDEGKCETLFNKLADIHADDFFICGPEQMIFTVKGFLEQRSVDPKKIHFELFTNPGQEIKQTKKEKQQITTTDKKSNVTIKLDGVSFTFDAGYDDVSIIDAGIKSGIDLPYSCKGGMCCTCKAKLLEGSVRMDVHWGLEDDEVAQGYILTCQSHPTSEKVVIDFDIK